MSYLKNKGWVRIHRKIEDNELWFIESFTRAQAWIDLFINANHKDGIILIRENIIPVKRGQIGWSELTMTKRWKWSRGKVRNFLKYLEKTNQIIQQKSNITTLISITNYETYQSDIQQTGQQTGQQEDNKQDNRKDTNKNVKNEKNEKECKERTATLETFIELKQMQKELENGFSILDAAAKKFKTKPDEIKSMIPDFIATCAIKGKENETIKEYRDYFSKWLDLQFSKKEESKKRDSKIPHWDRPIKHNLV